jgi:hypothetical protein
MKQRTFESLLKSSTERLKGLWENLNLNFSSGIKTTDLNTLLLIESILRHRATKITNKLMKKDDYTVVKNPIYIPKKMTNRTRI